MSEIDDRWQRYSMLSRLYARSERDESRALDYVKLAHEEGMDPARAHEVLNDLLYRGLVSRADDDHGPRVSISARGVTEVDRISRPPEAPRRLPRRG